MKIIITWLLFIGVIAVNALANILPINGYNTGQISAFYPNAFVPAGFTFSIWGVIYLLLLSYTIGFTFYSFKPQQHPEACQRHGSGSAGKQGRKQTADHGRRQWERIHSNRSRACGRYRME